MARLPDEMARLRNGPASTDLAWIEMARLRGIDDTIIVCITCEREVPRLGHNMAHSAAVDILREHFFKDDLEYWGQW